MNKKQIIDECLRMEIGQWLELVPECLYDNFHYGWPSIYRNIEEAILSSLPGSMWGCYRIHGDECI